MRRAAKTDANAKDLDMVYGLAGASICKLDAAGDGIPDRVIGYKGKNFLIEYKDGEKPPSARELRDNQGEFATSWHGQYAVVDTVYGALAAIGVDPYVHRFVMKRYERIMARQEAKRGEGK